MNFLGKNASWLVILIILVIVVVVYCLIPWKKIKNKKISKEKIVNEPVTKTPKKSAPMHGIYNGFNGGQALRDRRLIVVVPKIDACDLCQKFENQVLSLEDYDNKYLTMSEAVSKGYHHLGCTHIDADFFPGKTVISEPSFSSSEQRANFKKKLKKFKLENEIRNLKYLAQNGAEASKNAIKLEKLLEELKEFCNTNNLEFSEERLDPYLSDLIKYS